MMCDHWMPYTNWCHTQPCVSITGSPIAQPHTLKQAKALAMAAIDVYCQPHLVENMRTELKEALKHDEEE